MHVKASKSTIRGAYGIVAGDPGRISRIAAFFDEPEEVATSRGFVVYRGKLEGVSVFAAAHGIGSAGAAIVFEELALLGCHTSEANAIMRISSPFAPSLKLANVCCCS
jgi:uridine phosphorylase